MSKSDEPKGVYRKYDVVKISNPEKVIDAIVLEFDDPIARKGIWAWANEMHRKGFHAVKRDIFVKLHDLGFFDNEHWEDNKDVKITKLQKQNEVMREVLNESNYLLARMEVKNSPIAIIKEMIKEALAKVGVGK